VSADSGNDAAADTEADVESHTDASGDADSGQNDSGDASITSGDGVVVERSPFGIFGADHVSISRVSELGARSFRGIITKEIWDGDLPGLADASDPRLDPGEPWQLDARLKLLDASGLRVMVTFSPCSLQTWGNSAVNEAIALGLPHSFYCGYPDRPEVWFKLVNKVVERMDGDGVDDLEGLRNPIKTWQVGNEILLQWLGDPADTADALERAADGARDKEVFNNFVVLLEETLEVIRAADPDPAVEVAGPSFNYVDMLAFGHGRTPDAVTAWREGTPDAPVGPTCLVDDHSSPPPTYSLSRAELQANKLYLRREAQLVHTVPRIAPLVDIMDYHHYDSGYMFETAIIEEFRSLMGEHDQVRIVSTENGGPFFDEYDVEEHASSIVKRYLYHLHAGGTLLFWATMDVLLAWPQNFQNLALLDCDRNPRTPPFHAYREMVSLIPEGSVLRRLETAVDNVEVFEIDPGGGHDRVAFAFSKDGNVASLVPAAIPAFSNASLVDAAYITSATSTGLEFSPVNASESIDIDSRVRILRRHRATPSGAR
jgi:hypothetical protein